MLLAIDVGNTQTHVGMFRDDELVEHWRFATVRFATADELAAGLSSLLGLRELRLRRRGRGDRLVGRADARARVRAADRPLPRRQGVLVGPWLKTGMPIRIDSPQELGADRLVNAVAAYDRVGGACIAVDFGTAINYDVGLGRRRVPGRRDLAGDRDLPGGARRPGGAAAPGGHRGAPHAIGKGTQEAIQAGVVYGYAGQVDGILGRLREELGEEATAIATGGFAQAIVPFCEQVDEVDDLLTLTGLKLVWERNRG